MVANKIGAWNSQRIEMERDWKPVRTLSGGVQALRDAGEEFTPRSPREIHDPNGQELYEARLAGSALLEAFGETVGDIASRPFEKPPQITPGVDSLAWPYRRLFEDADRQGTPLSVFGQEVYEDGIRTGMGLFLVDNVPVAGGTVNLTAREQQDIRPYLCRINPDNLIGFEAEKRDGRDVVTELRVREWKYRRKADGTEEMVDCVRVYRGDVVQVWETGLGQVSVDGDRSALSGVDRPTVEYRMVSEKPTGFPDGEIPLVVWYAKKVDTLQCKPPLLGLANLNLKHWNQQSRLDAAIAHNLGALFLLTGASNEQMEAAGRGELKLTEGATAVTPNESADGKYIEISGTSLTIAGTQIDKTEQRMKAASLDPLRQGSATATGEMRAEAKEQSQAQMWVERFEWALWRAFKLAEKWLTPAEKLPEDFNVTLVRTSSLLKAASPQRTTSLQWDFEHGVITRATFLKERARSGDYADDFDPEAEDEAVEVQGERDQERQMQMMAAQIERERKEAAAVGAGTGEDGDPAPEADPRGGATP